VGFRPHVYRLAQSLGLTGFVGNDSRGVFIEIEGDPSAVESFQSRLRANPPPIAHIDTIDTQPIPIQNSVAFVIVESEQHPNAHTLVSPDIAICDDCLRELFDPSNRRYRYPFINCTHCGPRYTIIHDLPYDRPYTTMSPFTLCDMCAREYHDPADRRFHAQPNACPNCGPHIEYIENSSTLFRDEALNAAQAALQTGKIVAIKGIGGFHLACDATNNAAVERLRARKGRYEKPFAVMVRDLMMIRSIAHLWHSAKYLLLEHDALACPIVLIPKIKNSPLADSVAPGNPRVGVMLPYSPLHHLLMHDLDMPLIMTSANRSGEPMIIDNAAALNELAPIADAFLLHNRDIYIPCDDSVILAVDDGRIDAVPIRRSRGYAPYPIKLPFTVPPLLAVGGELKNTFCLTDSDHVFMSQHIGDMENLATLESFDRAINHMIRLFRIQPQAIIADMHPAYLSSQKAQALANERAIPLITVQHHHAHIASVMAEHGLDGSHPVIGFSFDGTGYGTDGTIWGGEVLIADYDHFERAAHLREIPLAGGDAAIKKPYRAALGHLWAAGIAWDDDLSPVQAVSDEERRILHAQFERGINTVPTSSMGRLFDAVASLMGGRQTVSYEAQAIIEMESWLTHTESPYTFDILVRDNGLLIDPAPVLRAIITDVRAGEPRGNIAWRFHTAVADIIAELARRIRVERGLNTAAFSGGVFQNAALLTLLLDRLQQQGFTVITHRLVPPNDGGLALGQAVIGARKLGK